MRKAGTITGQSDRLEINEDLACERRSWRVERIAWFLMMLMIAAALIGLFGSGPLSTGQAESADGRMKIEYQRLARYLAPATLRIRIAPGAARDGSTRVWLDRGFLNAVQLKSITPQPERSGNDRRRGGLCFSRSRAGSAGCRQPGYKHAEYRIDHRSGR